MFFIVISQIVFAGDVIVDSGKLDVDSKLYVDANGNVGIGTTTPIERLVVNGTIELQKNNEIFLNLKNTEASGRQYALVSAGSAGGIGTGKFSIYDRTSGISRLTIDASGNVGIGTTGPLDRLNIANGNLLLGDATNANRFNFVVTSSGMTINSNALADIMFLNRTTGNVGIGTTGPVAHLDIGGNAIGIIKVRITQDSDDTVGLSIRRTATSAGTNAFLQFCNVDSAFSCSYLSQDKTLGGISLSATGVAKDLHITGTGNVGIGTASPGTKLQISGGELQTTDNKIVRGGGEMHLLNFYPSIPPAFGATGGAQTITGTTWQNFGNTLTINLPVKGKILFHGFLSFRRIASGGWGSNVNVRILVDGNPGGIYCYIPWDAFDSTAKYNVWCPVGMSLPQASVAAGNHNIQMQIAMGSTDSISVNTNGEGDGYMNAILYGYDYEP